MPDKTPFDLQAHSTCSDGTLSPAEVVRQAHADGVELLALTDRDTVAGVEEALAAGQEIGVVVVPAVEISARHGRHKELHILGYGIDHTSEELLAALEAWRVGRSLGRTLPTVRDAISVIHAAGGVAVWAHPFSNIEDAPEVLATLEDFVGYGIDGVETLYVTHDPMQAALLDEAALSYDLLSTGSSDFHGPDHAIFSEFRAYPRHGLQPRLGPIESTSVPS